MVLRRHAFSPIRPLKSIIGLATEHAPLPVLIRPVSRDYVADAFVIGGVDARRIENRRLKPICSDDA